MTTRGRTLAALALSMLVFGRVAGMKELIMAGAAFVLVLGLGFALIWARKGRLGVQRSVSAARTFVGGKLRVELAVEARGRLGLGPVLLSDRVPRELGPSPRLALPGGTHKRERRVAYTITPRMRGRYTVGPVEITHTDPFGAVRRRTGVRGTTSVLVYPSFEEITALPTRVQRLGVVRHSAFVGHGDEFFALRSYVEGDDMRKIHWPTSVKTGQLSVRQEELLAEPRALIVLDTTAAKHRGRGPTASLEAAISACASVGALALRRRMRLDVVTTDGPLVPQRIRSEHQFLEALAILKPSALQGMATAIERTYRPRSGRPALVVVISPGLRRDELRALTLRVRGSTDGAIVLVDAASFEAGKERARRSSLPQPGVLGLPVFRLQSGQSFRSVWHAGVHDVAVAR